MLLRLYSFLWLIQGLVLIYHAEVVTSRCNCQKPCPPIAKEKCSLRAAFMKQAHKSVKSTRNEREIKSTAPLPGSICNSERLRRILLKTASDDLMSTKKIIQLIAERSFNEPYNVICAQGDFSYITNTDEYCQMSVKGRTCYIFKRHLRDGSNKKNQIINYS